jgi:hypothetical protein
MGRLGDESFILRASSSKAGYMSANVAGPSAGGLRSDYLSMFEGFVPYKSAEDAYNNYAVRRRVAPNADGQTSVRNQSFDKYYVWNDADNKMDTLSRETNTSWVPESKKYTFNLEFDASYDIGPYVGYRKDLFFGGYFGINGISSAVKPLSFTDDADDMLLWSMYLRLEPAVALHKNFYLLGLVGYENWRSKRSWMMVSLDADDKVTGFFHPIHTPISGTITPKNFKEVPIDYRDLALGIGFDWDMLERVGLHGRVKWMSHEDRGLNKFYEKHKESITKADEDRLEANKYTDNNGEIKDSFKNDWSTPVFSLEIKAWF